MSSDNFITNKLKFNFQKNEIVLWAFSFVYIMDMNSSYLNLNQSFNYTDIFKDLLFAIDVIFPMGQFSVRRVDKEYVYTIFSLSMILNDVKTEIMHSTVNRCVQKVS